MNAVETLEAAITKLETLKAASTPGPWDVQQFLSYDNDSIGYGAEARDVFAVFSDAIEEDAELIVASHRMVKPVLVILRLALATARRQQSRGETPSGPALDVAKAILGES